MTDRYPKTGACAECARRRMLAIKQRDPDAIRRANRQWYAKPENKSRVYAKRLAAKYRLTPEALAEMIGAQKGNCGACGDRLTEANGINIDHDHATGQVRGVLCSACNFCEGHAYGSALRLRRLAAYLDRNAPRLAV